MTKTKPEKLAKECTSLSEMYHEERRTIGEIAKIVGESKTTVHKALKLKDIGRRSRGARTGKEHPRWQGGKKDRQGNWRLKRKEALVRDGYECQDCGMHNDQHNEYWGQSLHVHHITPYPDFDDPEKANRLENLVTLCHNCHRDRH